MNQQRTTHSAKKPGGSRSRYSDFLKQRQPHSAGDQAGSTRVGQGLINIGIFVGLFVGILALFGLGLSQINRSEKTNNNVAAPAAHQTPTEDSTGVMPPPTVYPSGHAEVRMLPSPNPTSTAEIKKKNNSR